MNELPASAPSAAPTDIEHPRHIRSYVRRTGRLTVGQAKALDTLGPQLLIPFQDHLLDLDMLASTSNTIDSIAPRADSTPPTGQKALKIPTKTVFEIGFGMGEATAHIAKVLPDTLFLACEVHEPGVGALLKRIQEQSISNIRIISYDAVQVLDKMIPKASLDGIHIFFPDPWHKTRHNKRRLIQPPFVAKLVQHLKPGGYLHCATDWQPYAEQMLEVLSAERAIKNTASSPDGYAEKPHYRPLTKFENRGIKLGHGVWDLVFQKA
ncbi:tRNA (guanosine(46)-N7)-methyltransferase TrmB [Variovorax sp. PCZ-1]|uniref:tRNA (guanosine(46)-N7)-methyltransferase TrmB n=1 Tax=Variovorax sp. PCZ-1 TaxID=2835533 RepID=UPI001BCE8F16|nr:tRNA (guanosine(46)-N7)-methyltransferase TrmB [Variovorax sp. PCZ-1]MBS7807562.1 tRNA (guanosine(46)-N7)-methyltransferase TrmB [Variovorax sp. PCZ-1]